MAKHDARHLRLAILLVATLAVGVAGYRLLTRAALSNGTPAFSSLRTDPSGTSVLFGAYARAGLTVARGFESDSLPTTSPTTTVAFVLAPDAWDNNLSAQLLDFARRGGLVVLAAPPTPPPAPKPGSAAATLQDEPEIGLAQRLDASLVRIRATPADPANPLPALPASAAPPGAQDLPLQDPRTALKLSPAWAPLYQRDGHTYMAVRPVGSGRVLLATEATFLSNDSLAHAPDTALLSWFTAGRSTVWVDETLHQLQQVRGVPWLLRRYHLQPAVFWLLVTLGLLAWSVAASLERPPDAPPDENDEYVQESAQAGYIRLLRRAVPASSIPALLEGVDSSTQLLRRAIPTSEIPALLEGVAQPSGCASPRSGRGFRSHP